MLSSATIDKHFTHEPSPSICNFNFCNLPNSGRHNLVLSLVRETTLETRLRSDALLRHLLPQQNLLANLYKLANQTFCQNMYTDALVNLEWNQMERDYGNDDEPRLADDSVPS